GEQQVRIYDLNGRLVSSQQMQLPGEMELPPTLISGIYIIVIRTEGYIYRSRLLKQ
ncbi:MAG: T9SS type A sorting domain-containing protein, partial [Bacteroidales bacterium]|nr:T9SS type A sorting domain-containing protein [Bacteroidales bacterium]